VQRQLNTAELFARAGKYDAARQLVQRVATELQPPFNSLAALGETRLLLEMEKPAEAEQALNRVDQAIKSAGFQLLRHPAVFSRGRLAELRGNCAEALTHYQEAQKLEPTDATIFTAIGRCNRVLQQPALAVENIQRTLRMMPANGRANYELGLAYRDAGERTKAIGHLQRALLTWENADALHKLAREARAALAQMQTH
jgi:tetratricopeptide (TPR) repeat protein